MTRSLFPQRREDGGLSVAACFAPPDAAAREDLMRWAERWVDDRDARCGFDVALDLGGPPRLDFAGDGEVRVVFDAAPQSKLWKDALVRVAADAEQETDARSVRLFDLVGNRYHPATPA